MLQLCLLTNTSQTLESKGKLHIYYEAFLISIGTMAQGYVPDHASTRLLCNIPRYVHTFRCSVE